MNVNQIFTTIPGMVKGLQLAAQAYADDDTKAVQEAAARAETTVHPDVAALVTDRSAEAFKAGALWLVNMLHEGANEQMRQAQQTRLKRPPRRMAPDPPRMKIG